MNEYYSSDNATCRTGPDISRELCKSYVKLCNTSLSFSDMVRIACPTTCGICTQETEWDPYSPRNNETIDLRVGFVYECGFAELFQLLAGWMFWTNYTGGVEHPLIPTANGFVQLVINIQSLCPLPGSNEITCEQVREAATDLVVTHKVHSAMVGSWCPEAAVSVYDEAQVLHFMFSFDTSQTELPYSRFRYHLNSDQNDYAPLIRQAEVSGLAKVGIAYALAEPCISRAGSLRQQIMIYSIEKKLDLVYDRFYTQFVSEGLLYSLSADKYVEAYNVSVWDEVLLDMQNAEVEYAIFLSFAERVSIMNRIAELGINFKAISFDKESDQMERFLGPKTDYVTSTLEYHYSTKTADDVFGSNELYVQAFESVIGHKPNVWETFVVFYGIVTWHMVKKYNSFDTEKLISALNFMDVNSILGPVKFSLENVVMDVVSFTVQLQGGKLETILPSRMASSLMVMPTPTWECRALVDVGVDPSVCLDSQLTVWRICTQDYPVIKSAFNSTACVSREEQIAAQLPQQEGSSSGGILSWWLVTLVSVPLLAGASAIALLLWQARKHRSDALWLPEKEIVFAEDVSGGKVVLGQGSFGPVLGASFRGIQVAIKVVVPGSDSIDRSSNVRLLDDLELAVGGADVSRSFQEIEELRIVSDIQRFVQDVRQSASIDPQSSSLETARRNASSSQASPKRGASTYLAGVPHVDAEETSMFKFIPRKMQPKNRVSQTMKMKQFNLEASFLLKLQHPHILTVLGTFLDKDKNGCLVSELMNAGTLHSLLRNNTAQLETIAAVDILCNVADGLLHLHSLTPPVIHGQVQARNVFLNHHLTAKVAGFGISGGGQPLSLAGLAHWLAPELITFVESKEFPILGQAPTSKPTDVYAFGVTMWEIFSRQVPYHPEQMEMGLVDVLAGVVDGLRPKMPKKVPKPVRDLIEECWHKNPLRRPQMAEVLERLLSVAEKLKSKQNNMLRDNAHNTQLLHQVLPPRVVEALRQGKKVEPETFSQVTIFFSDIVGFTDISAQLEPQYVMNMLDRLYTKFDLQCTKYKLFKVETIGDAYMCVGGIPDEQVDQTVRVALFAMGAIEAAGSVMVSEERPELGYVNIRVGIHTGSVIASVAGDLNPRYCLFGDTVNTASRMESNSEKGRINLSPEANHCLRHQAPGAALHPVACST
eukprot:CAMPEP_0196599012 /NCGR_PEP_ID=MMETSP1081-20130531/94630_1 /TAXON_ID=36882 /ORGANISM="Pyramimonas amylifera, Strain CCMP720" /LENGTH=1163 /DNA_ID=CAMNT_0041924753 /DNA_START=503 /DNA_END=3995 /DNA_ORIENTATION=+